MTSVIARPVEGSALRQASLVAGIGLLLMSALAAFGALFVVEGLVTPGDAAQTTKDISGSEGLFRVGIVSLYAVVVLDVVVAWALFHFFKSVDQGLSQLAAWLRLAFAGVFLVAIGHLAMAAGAQDPMPHIDSYFDIWSAGLFLFGAHLVLIGWLAFRSGFVPRLLSLLLVIAGAGYVFDTVFAVLVPDSSFEVSTVTFLGEFVLMIWLLIRGRRLVLDDSAG